MFLWQSKLSLKFSNLQVPFMHFDNAVEDAKSERARILVLTRVLLV